MFKPVQEYFDLAVIEIESKSTRTGNPATQPIPAKMGRKIEEIAANSTAVSGDRQKTDIPSQGAEVASMVRQSFEFESDTPKSHGPEGHLSMRQRLHVLTIR
jgi:hypothetical protein